MRHNLGRFSQRSDQVAKLLYRSAAFRLVGVCGSLKILAFQGTAPRHPPCSSFPLLFSLCALWSFAQWPAAS